MSKIYVKFQNKQYQIFALNIPKSIFLAENLTEHGL